MNTPAKLKFKSKKQLLDLKQQHKPHQLKIMKIKPRATLIFCLVPLVTSSKTKLVSCLCLWLARNLLTLSYNQMKYSPQIFKKTSLKTKLMTELQISALSAAAVNSLKVQISQTLMQLLQPSVQTQMKMINHLAFHQTTKTSQTLVEVGIPVNLGLHSVEASSDLKNQSLTVFSSKLL